AAKLGDPVIIRAETSLLKSGVVKTEEGHAKRSIQHFSFDPVNVLVLNPFDWIPAARSGTFISFLPCLWQVFRFVARGKTAGNRERSNAFDNEERAFFSFVTLDHPRGAILVLIIKPLLP